MKNRRGIIGVVLVAALFAQLGYPLSAYESTKRTDLKLDEGLSNKESVLYAYPEKILINRVESPNPLLESDSESWIGLLYYYYITRLGFGDLPYNYLIDRSGNVYEGRSSFEGVIPELYDNEGAVLIGYLSNGSEVTAAAASSMGQLIEQISYKYGITQDEVETVTLKVSSKTGEGQLSKLEYERSDSIFAGQVGKTLTKLRYSDTENLSFKASVSEVKYEESVPIGGTTKITLKVKNEGDAPWFTLNDFIYIKTANGEDSRFAVNGVWDSFSTPTHIEGKTVLPGEEVDMEFEIAANSMPGRYSESFKFSRTGGKDLEGGQFKVDFTIEQGDLQLIEITATETGNLNVRRDPNLGGEVVGQVDTGAIFVVKEESNNWFKIEYKPGAEGWVIGRYVKRL